MMKVHIQTVVDQNDAKLIDQAAKQRGIKRAAWVRNTLIEKLDEIGLTKKGRVSFINRKYVQTGAYSVFGAFSEVSHIIMCKLLDHCKIPYKILNCMDPFIFIAECTISNLMQGILTMEEVKNVLDQMNVVRLNGFGFPDMPNTHMRLIIGTGKFYSGFLRLFILPKPPKLQELLVEVDRKFCEAFLIKLGVSKIDDKDIWNVYIAKDSTGLTKIGKSKNPEGRVQSLVSDHHSGIVLEEVIFVDNGTFWERALHHAFYQQNVQGEWFNLSPQHIQRIKWFAENPGISRFKALMEINFRPYNELLLTMKG